MQRAALLAVFATLAACAPKVLPVPGPLGAIGRDRPAVVRPVSRPVERGTNPIVEAAEHYLHTPTRGFRSDCSGFVMAVLDRAGIPITGNTASIYAWAEERGAVHHRKHPSPGDLVFFDDTYDRNDNGRADDPLSHVAVVIEVERNGTIVMAHDGTSSGRSTLRMNLEHPSIRTADDGTILNDWLRALRDDDPRATRTLAGELWRAFATVSADAS